MTFEFCSDGKILKKEKEIKTDQEENLSYIDESFC
jgi:hypothetical protein